MDRCGLTLARVALVVSVVVVALTIGPEGLGIPAGREYYNTLRWWWPWNTELKPIDVSPVGSDGRIGATARLWLPESLIPGQRMVKRSTGVDDTLSWWWPHRKNPKEQPVPWYTYNSSDAAYLVPGSLSWLLDSKAMYAKADSGLLDIGVAKAVSEFVAASYCRPENIENWNCSRCTDGFVLERAIFDPLWDLQGFVGWSDDLDGIIVSFRGTDSHSYYNWVENMKTWRTDLSLSYEAMPPQALVHGGFFYSYNSSYLAGNVTEAVLNIISHRREHPRGSGGGSGAGWDQGMLRETRDENLGSMPTVFVSGHSLGGALATLCALEMKLQLKIPDVHLITFGSPRVGNSVFASWYSKTIPQHLRFTHNRDMIPSLPPVYMGFSHVAQEIWIVDVVPSRTLVGVCDGSGEDPKCHRGACRFGFCSSLTDHLMYLSEMYTPRPVGC